MRYSLIYGGIAGAIIIAVTLVVFLLGATSYSHGSVLFGYLVMLVALSMIFVGVKRYRDVECGGVIRFGRAFGLGLGMALVAALIYIIGWEIYLATTRWDIIADMTAATIRSMQEQGAAPAAIAAKEAEMRNLAVMYQNPLFRIPITFIEIFPVGLVVSVVSALILRNPRVLPAMRSPAV